MKLIVDIHVEASSWESLRWFLGRVVSLFAMFEGQRSIRQPGEDKRRGVRWAVTLRQEGE